MTQTLSRDESADETAGRNSFYVPPFPPRPTKTPNVWNLIRIGRKNTLAVWPDFVFGGRSFSYNVLRRRVHVLTTPDCVKEVFVDRAADYEQKSPQQRRALEPIAGDGLIISDGETWRLRRRAVAPVTHVSRLEELAPVMSMGAERLVESWRGLPPGTEIDVLAAMAPLTASIIFAAIFGDDLDHTAVQRIVDDFTLFQKRINHADLLWLLRLRETIPPPRGTRIRQAAARIGAELDRMVAAVLAKDVDNASLLRAMADATIDGRPAMDRAGFRNEAAVMFIAGYETTANTLAWALFILSQDPDSERRLHAEVDDVLGDRPARFDDLDRLPFTRAIIQETLRLYPPVPFQARTAVRDTWIHTKPVRKGDVIALSAWILHRHRGTWTDPDAFVPDRFMPGGSGAPSRYAYVPFSIGPRACTGASFGQTEAIICLATIARRFRLRLRPGWAVEAQCQLSLRPGDRLPMTLEPRTVG